MAYAPPTESALHDAALDAYVNKLAGATVRVGDEIWARAWLVAAATAHVSAGLEYVEDQIFPSTADEANTARWAEIYEVERLEPTIATTGGSVEATGTAGTVIPAGTQLQHDDGTVFETLATETIAGDGNAILQIQATEAGSDGNVSEGTVLTWLSPPVGLDSTATVGSELTGGTDEEALADWQARIIERIRAGTGSGTAADYERWAKELDGVLAAHCIPVRRGPGTATVAVYSADVDGHRTPAGPTLRASVLAHLDTLRPVTAELDTPAITEVDLDVTVVDLEVEAGFDVDAVAAEVEAAIETWIWSLTTGQTARLTQLGRAIANVDGVSDYQIDAPTTDTTVLADGSAVQILVPGTIIVSLA